MKTLHLSIITGIGIAIVISFALIVVIMPSSLADQTGLSIGVEQNEVGVGEPISFFVEIPSQLQNSMYPTVVIVDEQNRTVWSDDDLPPNGYKGVTKVYYVQRDSENVPVINQTGKYTLIVTFADKKASKDLTVTGTIQENNMLHYYGAYTGIDKENTEVEIVDKPYYLTTVHKTPSDLTAPNDTAIQFHDVTFTFPGCGQCLPMPTVQNPSYYVNVQFKDRTNETLEVRDNQWSTIGPPMDFHEYLANGTKVFPNGTRGTWTPRFHMDPIVTVFSNHEYPQAGITVTHDSVKFLVSVENNSSQQYVNFGNTGNSSLSENPSKVSRLGNHWYGGGGPVVTITLDPLEQFKSGIAANDVQCKEGLQLMIKAEDSSPACVWPDTAQKLIERGWVTKISSSNNYTALTKILSQVFPTNIALSVGEPSVKGYLTSIDGTALSNKQINIIIDNATFENGTSIENILVGKTSTDQNGCFYFAEWDQDAIDRFQKDMVEKTPHGAPTDLVSIKAVFTGDSKFQGSSNATKFTYYTVAVPIIRPALSAFLVNGSDMVLEQGKSYNFTDFSTWGEALQLHTLSIEMKNLPCGIYEKTREISVANNQTQVITPIELRVEKTAPVGNFTTYISVNNQALEPINLEIK